MHKTIATLLLLLAANCLQAQTFGTRYEAGAAAGSGQFSPFWHTSNRQGMSSHHSEWAYARIGAHGQHHWSKSGIGLSWEADIVGGYNLVSSIFIQQAHVDLSWKKVNLSIGQKERWEGVTNHRLSTGSLTESGNARPIPQIRFELPEYWNIPGISGWVGIRGHLAYGKFTDSNWKENFAADSTAYTKNVLYHSKAGYMRIGNEDKFPLTAEIGLHMVTQFGGECYNFLNNPGENLHNPTRLKDFWTAFMPTGGDNSYHGMDQANIAGNMLGSWMGTITWNNKNWKAHLYYEHTFEDHSQMFWEYGLWTEQLIGLELQLKDFKWIEDVAIEYFNLKNHSGPIYHDSSAAFPDQISCGDNNYNHSWYGGWFNYGRTIATPLCTSPIYNNDNKYACYNNRVEAFHAGIEGSPLHWLHYRILYTRSNNWGTYSNPFKEIKTNRSGLVELTFTPPFMNKWSITTSIAFDSGELYGNNYGGMLTIARRNIFSLRDKK